MTTAFAPRWVHQDDTTELLLNADGAVGRVEAIGGMFKWMCATSDSSGTSPTLELAKARCEVAFWKEAWERDHRYDAPDIETMAAEQDQ